MLESALYCQVEGMGLCVGRKAHTRDGHSHECCSYLGTCLSSAFLGDFLGDFEGDFEGEPAGDDSADEVGDFSVGLVERAGRAFREGRSPNKLHDGGEDRRRFEGQEAERQRDEMR